MVRKPSAIGEVSSTGHRIDLGYPPPSATPPAGFAHCKGAASAPLAVASWLTLALALPSLFAVYSMKYLRQ